MFNECRHIKTSGTRCHSPALRDSAFCYFHTKLHRTAKADKSLPAPPMKVPLLEDAGAIQIALGQVIDAIASARIDHRTASLLLYALQIGAQVTPRRNDDDDRATVREVCSQQDGELIAPETALCDPGIDCDKCPSKHKCVSLRRASYRTMKKLLTSLNRQHDKWDEQNSDAERKPPKLNHKQFRN